MHDHHAMWHNAWWLAGSAWQPSSPHGGGGTSVAPTASQVADAYTYIPCVLHAAETDHTTKHISTWQHMHACMPGVTCSEGTRPCSVQLIVCKQHSHNTTYASGKQVASPAEVPHQVEQSELPQNIHTCVYTYAPTTFNTPRLIRRNTGQKNRNRILLTNVCQVHPAARVCRPLPHLTPIGSLLVLLHLIMSNPVYCEKVLTAALATATN